MWLHVARIVDGVLFWPALSLVVWGQLTPEQSGYLFEHFGDKVLHFTAYFGLGAMAAGAFKNRRPVVLSILGLIALGAGLEIVQSMVGRNASIFDEVANTAGALSGGLIARFLVERLRRRVEADQIGRG